MGKDNLNDTTQYCKSDLYMLYFTKLWTAGIRQYIPAICNSIALTSGVWMKHVGTTHIGRDIVSSESEYNIL